jgi:GNAT superfamily N-acetyltransferase
VPLEITTDPSHIDLDRLHAWLKNSYWASNRPKDVQAKANQNSLNFTALIGGEMVGFARIVTDRCTFAWLCDVFVDEAHRGQGVGKALMDAVVAHPDLSNIRRIVLGTKDAQGLYRQYGFEYPEAGRFMVRRSPDAPVTDP